MTQISVVIPARNRANVIARAIDSASRQTIRPLEIIVVDDASDDNGATIAAARAAAVAHIPLRILTVAQRSGAPNARNIGIAAARGDWIALLDSDDGWAETKLADQIALIEDDVVACFTDTVFDNGHGVSTTKFSRTPGDPDALVYENTLGGCSAAMMRRSTFDAVGGFDVALPSCQDWDMWLKLSRAGRIAVSPQPLTHYYFDATDRISRNPLSVERGHRMMYAKILAEYAPAERRGDIRRFQRFHLAQTLAYFTGIRRGVAWPALRNLIAPHPRTTRRSTLHLLGTVAGLLRR